MKFAELRRGQRCWLSECLDLKVNEHTDFILDGTGWGCHHGNLNDILAEEDSIRQRVLRCPKWKSWTVRSHLPGENPTAIHAECGRQCVTSITAQWSLPPRQLLRVGRYSGKPMRDGAASFCSQASDFPRRTSTMIKVMSSCWAADAGCHCRSSESNRSDNAEEGLN